MFSLQITIDLAHLDVDQLDAKLSAILAAAQELAEIGALSALAAPREENVHAHLPTANGAPATPASKPKKRGRPKRQAPAGGEALIHGLDWATFDALVRSEMARLGVDGRMPTTANWNNSRDVRLPTMAGVLEAYDVVNQLTLAAKLAMKPAHTALGKEPFVVVNGEVTQ